MKILMIEDNESVSEMMKIFFMNENWEATFKFDGQEGLDAFLEEPNNWDMVTLDLNLPTLDGITVCQEIRKVSANVPIIILSARDTESDQVIGLELGADDYVTKPFSPLTLIARIKALYRRAERSDSPVEEKAVKEKKRYDVVTPHFKMDVNTREARFDGQLIEGLTPKEFDLLLTLAGKPRQVFSREQLLELVWDYQFYGDERTVDAHIKKLRQKIEVFGPKVIQTVWGIGYKFDDSGVPGE
ncbi:response regulator transcription factor [Vagococcus xieshaowenii]|uniref:Response regulator transcription factor n=1 Tax=Vagococcus xieshaowenii TaxID=2562451 RepID=A0AAJ5JKS8_9ENTE|nr:response regulator transcription factor [Vagococcus xieshaowenii]QCA28083.1 response regulator transcription factor [Vagococcus xieshaowenii]TFZ40126.1 response regulator transcription factor [Vagococcus xieshaowenii]